MSLRARHAALAAGLGLALASCAPLDDSVASGAEIVGGTPSTGDPSVVALRGRDTHCETTTSAFCSGVLVAPRIVLTAAHCLDRARTTGSIEVSFGPDVASPTASVLVSEALAHPSYDPTTNEYDVAFLLLAEPAPVAQHALPTSSVDALAPAAVLRAVGFGVTARATSDSGIRREGTMQLGQVRPASFDAVPGPALTCEGDSGGPVFATIAGQEELVGITARGDFACASLAVQVRVDAVLADFVTPAVDAASGAPLGWPSDGPRIADLASITCASDVDCPALFTCETTMSGSRCVLPELGRGTFSSACATDAECGPGGACARIWPTGPDACRCFVGEIVPPPPPPPSGGGCAIGTPAAGSPWLLAVGAALAVATRRPRRERDRISAGRPSGSRAGCRNA